MARTFTPARRQHGLASRVTPVGPRHTAGLVAGLLTLLPHAVGAVPDDVASWFTDAATGTISEITLGGEEPAGRPRDVEVAVAEPRPLYQWSEEYLSGESGEPAAEAVTTVDEWVAAFTLDGRPAGVVVAWRHEDEVQLAYTQEDADLAGALAALPTGALVVHEPMIGAHFAVVDDTVHTLRSSIFPAAGPLTLADFQPVLAEQVAQKSVPDEPVAGSRWWVPVVWVGLGGLAVAGAALAVAAAWRRNGRGHT